MVLTKQHNLTEIERHDDDHENRVVTHSSPERRVGVVALVHTWRHDKRAAITSYVHLKNRMEADDG